MNVAEIAIFNARAGIDEVEVLEKAKRIETVLSEMPGFVKRELLRTGEGKWVDLVRWRSMNDARAAAEKVMSNADCLSFFDLIEKDTMIFLHGTPALTYEV